MLVQWQQDFESGHAATDSEHREVVDLLNALDAELTAGSPPDVIERALEDLGRALAEHLHADHHAVERVQSLRRVVTEGGQPDHSDLRALAHWWLEHLCRQDCAEPDAAVYNAVTLTQSTRQPS